MTWAVRWVAVRHAPDHIHLVATLARQDRIRPKVGTTSSGSGGLPGRRTAVRAALHRPGGSHRGPAADPRRDGAGGPARLGGAAAGQAAAGGLHRGSRGAHGGGVLRPPGPGRGAGPPPVQHGQPRRGHRVCGRPAAAHREGRPGHLVRGREARGGPDAAEAAGPVGDPQARDPLPGRRAACPGGRAACSAPPSRRRRSRPRVRRSSSPGCAQPACWCGSGSARSTPVKVTGYAVTLPGCTGSDGTPRWYGGGRLHDSLTLPRLRARVGAGQSAGAERSGAFRFTAPERAEIYRHAARQAAVAAEHLRHCAADDPGSGADAAWAAADTLHAAARATGSRVLRCAADGYDRAARAPHRRYRAAPGKGIGCGPPRGCSHDQRAGSEGMGQAGALARNLVALVDAVAELRAGAGPRRPGCSRPQDCRAVARRIQPGTEPRSARRPCPWSDESAGWSAKAR